MTPAQVLAYCRAGLTTDEIADILKAITSGMNESDPVCEVLDKAYESLADIDNQRELDRLWAEDDRACRRAAALNVPQFLRSAI